MEGYQIVGYGVITDGSEWKWQKDASTVFIDFAVKNNLLDKDTLKDLEDFIKEDGEEDAKEIFVNDYENETYWWNGLEGLIVDTINHNEFNDKVVFRNDDYSIYVPPTIPSNKEERDNLPTEEDIQRILTYYLAPLTTKPAPIHYLEVYLD